MSIGSQAATAVLSAGIIVFSCGISRAQTTAPATGTTSSANGQQKTKDLEKAKNYFERTFTITGQIRERWEGPEGKNFTVTPADSYVLSRLRLGLWYRPLTWIRFYGEAQDSRALFYDKSPSSAVSDPFDWRQGYVEVGAEEGAGWTLRVGRQDLFIGSNRLLTTGDWSNVTKPYDIARGNFSSGILSVDLIAGSQVLPDPGRMDRSKPGEHLYVAYTALKKLIPGASIEPYLMAKTQCLVKGKEGASGGADTLYPGGRIIGTTPGRLDYTIEGVREAGSYANDSINAWGYIGGGGWTVAPSLGKLRVSSDFTFASGDDGKKDHVHDQFDFLYGSQQTPTSLTGLFAWRNIEDFRAGVDFRPLKKLTAKLDYRNYWLATVADGLYNSSGTETVINAKATSNHIGEGAEIQLVYALNVKTSFGGGVGTLSPGAYLVQSKKTNGYTYPYFYFQRSF